MLITLWYNESGVLGLAVSRYHMKHSIPFHLLSYASPAERSGGVGSGFGRSPIPPGKWKKIRNSLSFFKYFFILLYYKLISILNETQIQTNKIDV